MTQEWSHDGIGDIVAKHLKAKGWHLTFSNLTNALAGEQPDVLGINIYGKSIIGEVKVSLADFKKDKSKIWRLNPSQGMGDYRVYITPKGLLTPEDIPYGWMLWEVDFNKRNKITVIKGKRRYKDTKNKSRFGTPMVTEYLNTTEAEYNHFVEDYQTKSYRSELDWLVKICRRSEEDGVDLNKYANNYQRRKL